MEPPQGFWATLWNFICFLPYFVGLLILGIIKGAILCPLIFLIIAIGNSAIILGLWPAHIFWTWYCIIRAKLFGPVLKLLLYICVSAILIAWPVIGIVGSILGGLVYGFLTPLVATFEAIEEGKTNKFFNCFFDGTLSAVKRSFTVVRDFMDVCFYSYFSLMDDLRMQEPKDGEPYDIRLLYLPGAFIVGVLGISVDFVVITCMAAIKSPYMLFKGWHQLFHDMIGREGPFLETICVPFAGLAIILWPVVVVVAVICSMVSSIFLGAFAGVVAYQESSVWFGLCYIVTSLAIYDEYGNDVLYMPEGSCFPRLQYRKKVPPVRTSSLSTTDSLRGPPSRSVSLKTSIIELKSLELLNALFLENHRQGTLLISEGLIIAEDFEDLKSSNNENSVINVGLPTYCILLVLLRAVKAGSEGLLLRDGKTEITSMNRPKDALFDWFFNPLLVIRDQIKAHYLSEEEENYFCKLVLLNGNPERLKNLNLPVLSEIKLAELDALARRLRGITRSISRYPTFKRRFNALVNSLFEELAKKNGYRSQLVTRSRSMFVRMISQTSSRSRTNNHNSNNDDSQSDVLTKDIDIV